MSWEKDYKLLIHKIMSKGQHRHSRAGNTYSIFGETLTIDIETYFPLLLGRKMFPMPIIGELAAMLKGPRNIADFKKYGCNYWDAWGAEAGGCLHDGEVAKGGELELDYGNSWIDFNGVNQLKNLVHTLKTNPTDRRMIITGWRPDRLSELSLPCCHMLYQWYVRGTKTQYGGESYIENKYLDMVWYQRSVDTMIGLPSDIVLAAVWNIILANECGYTPGRITMMLGDTHIYENHIEGVDKYLHSDIECAKPTYDIDKNASVFNFTPEMLNIIDYYPNKPIGFKLNV